MCEGFVGSVPLGASRTRSRNEVVCSALHAYKYWAGTAPVRRVPRGRNARKNIQDAHDFKTYMYLRRRLSVWSETFRDRHGRIPTLTDVKLANIEGLEDMFLQYINVRDRLWKD
ncbi:hypothetical protein NDN08_004384 [Rhodosorus marinus]|uniref:Uncharacterized protein n=1 Tax=Rhodosorus marinus TaxID=101924 RepID=A0AAV8UL41_9RHOD|nr:hypothetical protein NDN08_004384 [Rhodosorus marinus]